MKRRWYVNLAEETDAELIDDFITWFLHKSNMPVFNKSSGKYGCNGREYECLIQLEINNANIPKITLIDWCKIRNEI